MKKIINILAIESSCDETAVAIVRGNPHAKKINFTTLSTALHSQISIHSQYGGVVPEMAARNHIENIEPLVQKCLSDAGVTLKKIDVFAVTAGPGLIPALIVGTEYAKGLAFATNKPLLPVNHMDGHLYSAFAPEVKISYPLISLIVSGGHTMLVLVKSERTYKLIGQTVDDAVGEAFDKVGKLLGLPYPGGPEVSKAAERATSPVPFPRPMLASGDFNFSFSGLKTAVRQYKEKNKQALTEDICAGFQDAAIDVLVQKTLQAAKKYKAKAISLGGGVSANKKLRETLHSEAEKHGLIFIKPPHSLCTDNAEMIAMAAYYYLRAGKKTKNPLHVKADPRWETIT